MLPRLTLVVAFRETGWRRPLTEPTVLEVWGPEGCVARLPATYVVELVRWHLSAMTLQTRLAAYVEPPPPPPPRLIGTNGRRLRTRKSALTT